MGRNTWWSAEMQGVIYRKKASKLVCHSEKFRYGICKGKFEVIEM